VFFYDQWPGRYIVDQSGADIVKCFGVVSNSRDLDMLNRLSDTKQNEVAGNHSLDWNDDEVNHLWGSRVHGGG